ncbi:MAG TPA: chorismate-binding protein, partial [Bacteroidia bacterium]
MPTILILFESAEVLEVKPVIISPFEGGVRRTGDVVTKIGTIQCRLDKETYLQNVNKLLAHIKRGDIYEINYCIEFFCENVVINPHRVFKKLNELTQAPFAQLLKYGDEYIICASPERFIQKRGNTLITQPMKGTARRSTDAAEDEIIKNALRNNLKEQTENVMAVDVARNDL